MSFDSSRFPLINSLLLHSNPKTDELSSMLEANAPYPVWLEQLLDDTRKVPGFGQVICEMRRNPDKLVDFSTNLHVAQYYRRKGLAAEFLIAAGKKTPDLLLNSDSHTEVKTLVDSGLWPLLIRNIRSVISSYDVIIGTDYELTRPQVERITDEVRDTVSSLTSNFEEKDSSAANLAFRRSSNQSVGRHTRVLSIGPRILDGNSILGAKMAMDLRGNSDYAVRTKAATITRLQNASQQLEGYAKTVAVLDLQRHFTSDDDFLDELFLGTLQSDRDTRANDGILAMWETYPNIQAIVVFVNLHVKRVFTKPGSKAEAWLGPEAQ